MGLKDILFGLGLITATAFGAVKAADNLSKYPTVAETKQVQQVDFKGAQKMPDFDNIGWFGYGHSTYNDSIPIGGAHVEAIRTPLSGQNDTLYSTLGYDGFIMGAGDNFNPPAVAGETLTCYIYKDTLDTLYETTQWRVLSGGFEYLYESHLDDPNVLGIARTVNVTDVSDTNTFTQSLPLSVESWVVGNPGRDTMEVDTLSVGGAHFHYHDYYWNTEPFVVNPGDTLGRRYFKLKGDSCFWSDYFIAPDQSNSFGNVVFASAHDTIHANDPVRNFGLEGIILPDTVDSGTTFTPGIIVRNEGIISEQPAYLNINDYNDSIQQVFSPGYDTGQFAPYTFNTPGNHVVSCSLGLEGDINPADDTLSKVVYVQPTGISEHKQKALDYQSRFWPSITKGEINYNIPGLEAKTVGVYNSLGQEISERKLYGTGTFKIPGPAGVYFLKPKETDLPPVKVIKTK